MTMKLLVTRSVRSALDGAAKVRSGSFIFYGEPHVGKATAARELARSSNCLGDKDGPCVNCRRLEAGAYPDFVIVTQESGSSILIGQIRALKSTISLKPYQSGQRVVLIDGADLLTDEAQNALLKLIEEPSGAFIFKSLLNFSRFYSIG